MDEFASRDYPVKEHMGFQRRMWVVERTGWTVLAVIALLGLTGLFGSGWLSEATASNTALSVDYERFERATRLAQFTFHFAPGAAGERHLRLNAAFRKNFETSTVQPAPARSEVMALGE